MGGHGTGAAGAGVGVGRRQSKDVLEVYRTPEWAVHRLLDGPLGGTGLSLYTGEWLDPACGDGALARSMESHRVPSSRRWTQIDIRGGGACDGRADYLGLDHRSVFFGFCIMNPPFSMALEFSQRATEHCGVVFMLQRLNWLASAERASWLRYSRPAVFVLPNRPGFTHRGTDQHDYAWFAWGLGHSEVRVLDTTPADIRRANRPPLLLPNTGTRGAA